MQRIKTILRNFYYNRFYTILNISGLGIGLSCFGYILLYVTDDLSYDKHYTNYDKIYRLGSEFTVSERHQKVAKTPFPLGPAIKREFPGVKEYTRFLPANNIFLRYKDKKFYEESVYFADSGVFNIFDHKFIYGNRAKALTEPNSIVLTRSLSNKYFDDINPIGKIISFSNQISCKVTGVIEDLPPQTHLKFDALVSIESYAGIIGQEMFNELDNRQFFAIRLFTYILLEKESSIKEIHSNFDPFFDKYMADICEVLNAEFSLLSTRIDKIHLWSNLDWDMPAGDIRIILIFSLIAIFILIIAGINYMNLSTARSSLKAKEVGVRKVFGASRGHLIKLYLTESITLAMISLIFGLLIMEVFLPMFNQISGKEFFPIFFDQPEIIIILITATLFTGLFSGTYPAFYLSSFIPVKVLKGVIHTGCYSGIIRKVLITFQFTITAVMIATVFIVSGQLKYIQKTDLGFDHNNVLIIQSTDTVFRKKMTIFKKELATNPNIINVAISDNVPGRNNYMDVFVVEGSEKMEEQLMTVIQVDYDFIDLMDIQIKQGRKFDHEFGKDPESSVIINSKGAKHLGWQNNAIGKTIKKRSSYGTQTCKKVGVTEDFNYISQHNEVGTVVLFLTEDPQEFISVKINEDNSEDTIEWITKIWAGYNPHEPLEMSSMGNMIYDQYSMDKKLGKIIGYFAMLSIIISIIGLFGLTSFITERFSKNIGIRKLLGASSGELLLMLSRDFLKLIAISVVISYPITWFFMESWLDNFAYRLSNTFSWFLISAFLVFIIAILTVIIQTLKTALTSPVRAIRYE
ncbi:MAG: ABC transporter permease [Bacteroidales bacterium]|nr:ABC transporter permease [Bacteroidales bacterium]